jgi:hypothetical protein
MILDPGWIGGPCSSVQDCSFAGAVCLTGSHGYPGGMCTEACTLTCPDMTGPLDSVTFCIDDGAGSSGICVSRCDHTLSPTGCRAGYVCLPERRMNEPTTVIHACVPISGVPGQAVPADDIGSPCSLDSDCARGTCLTDLPSGYCTQEACDTLGCPGQSRCEQIGGTQETYYVCAKACSSNADCRASEGYTCGNDHTCWGPPATPAVCDLSGGPADCTPHAAGSSANFIVVTKHSRRLTLCQGMTARGSFCVGLGASPVLDKERAGDRRTPEGVFYVPSKNPMSQYYKAFVLSYPDIPHAMRGLAAGIITQSEYDLIASAQSMHTLPPQDTGLGGWVEIHGDGSSSDWTWGCIANDNSTIDILWPVINEGDTVVVLH